MDQYRLVAQDGKEYGPVDREGLLRWIREGRILKNSSIRKNDDPAVEAGSLPEFADAFVTPPPGPGVPPIATTVALPSEFSSWAFIGQAWELVKPHWLPLSAMFLIMTVMGAIPYLGPCLSFVIGGTIMVGINRAILGMLAGRAPTIEMMFGGFDRFGQAFLASFLTGLLVFVGLVFCIVPGVILSIMWLFTNLILAETDKDFWTAMQTSAELTGGHWWELFCLLLACLVILILGLLACGIGVVVAEAVAFTALALAYRFLQAQHSVTAG